MPVANERETSVRGRGSQLTPENEQWKLIDIKCIDAVHFCGLNHTAVMFSGFNVDSQRFAELMSLRVVQIVKQCLCFCCIVLFTKENSVFC